MKQREHAVLDNFTVIKKVSPSEMAGIAEQRVKLPKLWNEATRVFAFLRLQQWNE
jgi:hypothetical protein